jgi:hypothetical protein
MWISSDEAGVGGKERRIEKDAGRSVDRQNLGS